MIPERYLKLLPEYDLYTKLIGQYDNRKDYAGPEGSGISVLIPRTLYGINCNIAFYAHDALYEQGGQRKDRFNADVTMLGTILWVIENHPDSKWLYGFNWARKHAARLRAIKYFEAVRSQGYKSFKFRGQL